MMKKKLVRTIRTTVVALVVLAVVGVAGAALLANAAVKAAVEKAGVKTLNVPVQIETAKVSPLGGSVTLRKATVSNPEGYQGPALLTLKSIDVAADIGTLLGDKVLVRDMRLEGMEIFIEHSGLKNNLYEVVEPLRRPREPTGKALFIDTLRIGEVVVHVALPSLPGQSQAQTIDLKVAPITMTDLGRNERMDTPLLITKVVLAVAAGIADQRSDILPKETIDEITGILDKAVDIGRIIFGGKKDR